MTLSVEYGNITEDEARRLGATDHHEPGSTEPWIVNLVTGFARSIGARRVFETGAFMGDTTMALARILERMGGGELIAAEIDPERAQWVRERIGEPFGVDVKILEQDALQVIQELPDDYLDLAWVDDDHSPAHVEKEINALWTKIRVGGLMLFHDVYGVYELRVLVSRYGGYSLELPRMGPAGGLGIIQLRD